MLGRLAGVVCLPESQFFAEYMPAKGEPTVIAAAQYSERFTRHYRYTAWREAGVQAPRFDTSAMIEYRGLVADFVRSYAEAVGAGDIKYFVEHSPANLFCADSY